MIRKLFLIIIFWISVLLIYISNAFLGNYGLLLFVRNIAFVSFVIAVLPKKIDLIVSTIFLLFISLYVAVQSTYFEAFNLYGLTKTIWSLKSEVVTFASSINEFISIMDLRYFVIPLAYYFIHYYSFKKISIFNRKEKKNNLLILSISLLLFTLISATFFHFQLSKTETSELYLLRTSNHYVYNSVENVNTFVSRFGLFNLIFRDLSSFIIHPFAQSPSIEEEITTLITDRATTQSSNYSGIFEGKSLILIEAESLNNFVIDPELTPTLYKMKKEGFFIEGYNSPLLTGSTSDSEFLALTSMYPTYDGKITFNDYSDNAYPQTLATSLNNQGYFSIAAHNNYGDYYNRNKMFPNLGLTFFDCLGLGMEPFTEDSVVLDYLKWITYGMEKSFTFFVTYNGHQPYTVENLTDLMKPYLSIVQKKYPDMPIAEQVYLAKNMELDSGLEKLLLDYQNSGVLDNTVIMIYGDHYPKGLFENNSIYQESCAQRDMSLETCFETPLIIYNSEINGKVINKVSSTIDISPTIYDLFSIPYNSSLTFGHSVFDPTYNGFGFSAWDIIETDHYIYDSARDTINPIDNGDYETYLDEGRRLFYEYSILRKIVPLDYFNSEVYKQTFESNQ